MIITSPSGWFNRIYNGLPPEPLDLGFLGAQTPLGPLLGPPGWGGPKRASLPSRTPDFTPPCNFSEKAPGEIVAHF